MAIFLSTFANSIDGKGRVVVPKEFRNMLEDYNGFVAFRSHNLDSVDCFSMQRMQKLSDHIDSTLDPFSLDRDVIESAVFADAITLRFDKDGRVVLPKILLEHAKIEEKIAFVGMGATFQLWNPSLFENRQKEAREILKNKRKEKEMEK